MMPRIEHIGSQANAGGPKRFRRWLTELFGSSYTNLLERDLLQARLERDRAQNELTRANDRLINALAAMKNIDLPRIVMQEQGKTAKTASLPPTTWQQIQAQAIADNAKAEEEDFKHDKSAAKEN